VSEGTAVERVVARTLKWGGLLSVSLVLGGLAVYSLEGAPTVAALAPSLHGRPGPAEVEVFTSLADIRRGLAQHPPDALAIAALGLACLLATPVTAVALAIPAFWREGDRQYAAIAAVVLGMLLVSLALAGGV
jgi:uncharacterized membrane protein